MILLTGIPTEPPLALVIAAAEAAGIDHAVFNQRLSHFSDIELHLVAGQLDGTLRVQETDWRLSDFQGVYVRLMDQHELPENQSTGYLKGDPAQIEKSLLIHEALQEWIEITPARVMNRIQPMGSNLSKPYQAQLIGQVGFSTPPTLITNSPQAIAAFHQHYGRVIYKSISSVRSIVRELDAQKMNELDKIRSLPTQFQAYIPGHDIRVHVVGDVLFATDIQTPAIDYRYANRDNLTVDMQPLELPTAIEDRCFELSQRLGLPLCGIDLRLTPDQEYYCLEVNPCPGYSYYQETTGQPIAQAIVSYLEFGTAKRVLQPVEVT